jgi:hypothetical protein
MTIGAPQQLSRLSIKIRTTSTVVHEAKNGDRKLNHLFSLQESLFDEHSHFSTELSTKESEKVQKHDQSSTKPRMGTGRYTTSPGVCLRP